MTNDPKLYFKRQQMMDAIDDNYQDNILLSKDYLVKTSSKKFAYLPLANPTFNDEYLKVNRNMYEIIPPSTKVKLYFDLEMEYEGLDQPHMQHCCEEFIYFVASEIQKLFSITLLMSENDIVIEDSCRTNKLSYHIIINNKLYFDSVLEMKLFIVYLQSRFKHPENDDEEKTVELLTYNTPKGEQRFIFDPIPYGRFQNFRFLGQSKMDSPHVLKNWTPYWTGIDTLVRLYHGEGDRKLISREMLENLKGFAEENQKHQKHQKRKNKKQNIDATPTESQDLVITGLKLFVKKPLNNEEFFQMPTWKRALHLISNTNQSWVIYRNVAMAVKGCGGTLADFIEWAKLSPKYTPNDEIQNDFHKFHTRTSGICYGLTYLRNLAKKCSPEHYRGSNESLNRYFELNTSDLKVIKEKSQFVSMEGTPDENNILDEAKTIILHAYLGRGKTTAIKRLLKNYNSFLFLSPRQTFAKFIASEFDGTVCYMDCDGNYKHEKFVISVESLYKLKRRDYDVICLDESESIFCQFSSTTMQGRQLETWKVIEELVKNAKKVIYADAFITNRTLDIARHFNSTIGGDITLIQNETPAVKRVAVEIQANVFAVELLKSIKDGKKNYVCYSSVNKLIDNLNRLQGAGLENEAVQKVMDNALIYHAKVGDEVFNSLSTINESWKSSSMVITSPTNTIGCSYSPEEPADFDAVWINAFPTCVVRDTFQTQMRVRHLKENKMVFCLPDPRSLYFSKMRYQLQYDVFDAYDENSQNKEHIANDLISNLIAYRKKNDKNDDCFELYQLSDTYNKHDSTPEVLKHLYFANFYEETVSAIHYEEMFRCFLKKCGYFHPLEEGVLLGVSPNTELDSNMISLRLESDSYVNIPTFTSTAQRENVATCIKNKRATAGQKLQMKKYWFDKLVTANLVTDDRSLLFHSVYDTAHGKQFIENLKLLHYNNVPRAICKDNEMSGCGFELNDLTAVKLTVVTELNKLLGIPNAGIGEQVIERKTLEDAIPYIQANIFKINTSFKFRSSGKYDTISFKYASSIVRKIYESFCGLQLKPTKNNSTHLIESFKTKQTGLLGFSETMFIPLE